MEKRRLIKISSEYMRKTVSFITLTLNSLFRSHRVIMPSFAILILVIFIWKPDIYHQNTVFEITTFILKKNKNQLLLPIYNQLITVQSLKNKQVIQFSFLRQKINVNACNHSDISIFDILNYIFNQKNSIIILDTNYSYFFRKYLNYSNTHQRLAIHINKNKNFKYLKYKISYKKTRIYNDINLNLKKISNYYQQYNRINIFLKGIIDNNFVSSAYDAGLTIHEINTVIQALQCKINFYKLKKGDEFAVLVSRNILNRKHKNSHLIAVRLYSSGKNYYAIRAGDGKFYDIYGNTTELSHKFLRFPTEKQFRVSSNFDLHRIHPITRKIIPHYGVDFAVPQGTPVLAVSDGEVIIAKRSIDAGYYVSIRHGKTYTTRYMHLYKLLVKQGQKVKWGECIALSGNTGRSTGPHLHYEVWLNKQAVNPLTIRLPQMKRLVGKDLYEYLTQAKLILAQLDLH